MLKITEKKKSVVVLGAGGTGSWFASMLSKIDTDGTVIIDGDIVEPKNVLRQNFTNDDVNKLKAEVIADRYGLSAFSEFIKDGSVLKEHFKEIGGVPVVVGCLDNNASRKIVHDLFHDEDFEDFIWIDSGNAERNGQTYVAVKENGEIKYPSPLDFDTVLMNYEGDERRPDQISCAEHSESAPQNVTANVTAATILFDVVNIVMPGGLLLGNKFSWDTRTMSFMTEEVFEEQVFPKNA